MRESQLTGRLRLRHLKEVTEAKAEEMVDEAPRFRKLAKQESAPKVFSAFNLFPTPPALAERLCSLAWRPHEPVYTHRVLEPSAGTGNLLRAASKWDGIEVTAVEIDSAMSDHLKGEFPSATVHCRDFLECTPSELGTFHRIIMNPPFKMGRDIKHILHALEFLNGSGRLVAICAAGEKRERAFRGLMREWHALPAGSFKESHTNVAAAIVVFEN